MTTVRTEPVLLVGGGPGDPDLLTLRAEAALAAARVVVTDATLADLAAAFAPRADLTFWPRDPGSEHWFPRPERSVGSVAAVLAAAGPGAVRLYLGDPWLHPAFAAEAAALTAGGVTWEAVPGPAAALALAATAGIAVHHRPVSVCVTLLPPGEELPPAVPGRTFVTDDGTTRFGQRSALMASGGDVRTPEARS